jgi:FkbM family methyltransferase
LSFKGFHTGLLAETSMKAIVKKLFAKTPISGFVNHKIYDAEVVKVLKKVLNKDSNCIEVGFYKGAILKQMIKLAPKGTHFGFEPIPDLYYDLKKTLGTQPNVHLYNLAMSDKKDAQSFVHLMNDTPKSGLERKRYNGSGDVLIILVKTDKIDNLIPPNHKVDLINIEIEGGEEQVLIGAKETIKRNKPVIIFEHIQGVAEFYGTDPGRIFDLLHVELGMNISLMERFLKDEPPLTFKELSNEYHKKTNHYFIAYPEGE